MILVAVARVIPTRFQRGRKISILLSRPREGKTFDPVSSSRCPARRTRHGISKPSSNVDQWSMASRCSLQARGVLALLSLLNRGKQRRRVAIPYKASRLRSKKGRRNCALARKMIVNGGPVDSEGRVNGLTIRNLP